MLTYDTRDILGVMCATFFIFSFSSLVEAQSNSTSGITPDTRMLSQIDRSVNSITSLRNMTRDEAEREKQANLSGLQRYAEEDIEGFVLQSSLYIQNLKPTDALSEEKSIAISFLRSEVCRAMEPYKVVTALSRCLGISDKYQRQEIIEVLEDALSRTGERGFSGLIPTLVSDGESQDVIDYMFERNPGAAVKALCEAYVPDGARCRRIEQMVDLIGPRRRFSHTAPPEVANALDALSRDAYWGTRYYVALLLSEHRALRSPHVVDLLLVDSDKRVRGAIEEIPPYERYARTAPPPNRNTPEAVEERMERIRWLEKQGAFEDLKRR